MNKRKIKNAPLGQVHISLLAGESGEAAADTLDRAEGNDNLLATVDVGVHHTENVGEVLLVLDNKSLNKRKKETKKGRTCQSPSALQLLFVSNNYSRLIMERVGQPTN